MHLRSRRGFGHRNLQLLRPACRALEEAGAGSAPAAATSFGSSLGIGQGSPEGTYASSLRALAKAMGVDSE